MTHTPTPWHTKNNETEIADSRGWRIAYVSFEAPRTADERDANAAFIVRACNSHEQLLEACKALLICLRSAECSSTCPIDCTVGDRPGDKARAAIAKAEEGDK